MAQFNPNICDISNFTEADYISAGMCLQGLLSEEEYNKLKKDWHHKYGDKVKEYPYWKYCLDKIQVTYKPRS